MKRQIERMGYGAVGEGRGSVHVLPGNKVDGQYKPRRMKSLMGVGGGRLAGAWVTYKRARSCAWLASRRVEQVCDIPQNEPFRATLAVILRARERLTDVEGGRAHLERILSHMDALHKLNWDLLGQDYDGYDGGGPSGGISEGMIAAVLGERGSLEHPLGCMEREHPDAPHLGYTELEVGARSLEIRCVATVITHQAHDWSGGG